MANVIKIRRKLTAGAPNINDLADYEGSLVVPDKTLYYRVNGTTMVEFKDKVWIDAAIASAVGSAGGGDMMKSVYDANNDGKVDVASNADQLGGVAASSYATQTYVNTQISTVIGAAPETLDTLNELAAALGDDPNFATSIATALGLKLDANSTIDGGTIS